MNMRWETVEGVTRVVTQHVDQQSLIAVAIVTVVCAFAFVASRYLDKRAQRKARLRRGLTMPRGDRRQYVRVKIADVVTDGVESLILRGEISGQEAQKEYKNLADYLDNEDLRPRKVHREAVRARLKRLIQSRKDAAKIVPIIPGPLPGEEVKSNVIPISSSGRFGAKALARKTA